MRTLFVAAVFAAVVMRPLAAAAQVSAAATLGTSFQGEGDDDSPYLGPPFGGSSVAAIGMIDGAISSHFTIGAEVSVAGGIEGTQFQRAGGGSNHFVSTHRDTVLSILLKAGTPAGERVRAAAVVGGGIAQRRTHRVGTFSNEFSTSPITRPFEDTLTDYVWTLTAGADVAVGITDHVAAVGVGRLYRLKDDDREPFGVVRRGVSSTILRIGAGLQVRF
jgi:hypothetical protein